jgi:tRNA pseudouridine38-40 synthase
MHWKLTLTYDGTPYSGWQVQPGHATVQGALADALFHLTGERVLPQGSGRTDAGVHALAQVCSFHLTSPLPAENLRRALNRALPASIRVLTAEPAPEGFHARHSALRKSYEYRILPRRSPQEAICPPFLAPYVWDCRWQLNPAPMQAAAALLLGTHDFTSFAASDPDLTQRSQVPESAGPNPVKTLDLSAVTAEAELLLYRVTGSGFLHHMVRNIVGTLVEVGRGALQPDAVPAILAARDRSRAGPTAPPNGLFLVAVEYPESFETQPPQ